MSRQRQDRMRSDGTAIDPVKNLAEFVQSFPATGEPEPDDTPVTPPQTPAVAAAPTATSTDPEQPSPVAGQQASGTTPATVDGGAGGTGSGTSPQSQTPAPAVPQDRAAELEQQLRTTQQQLDQQREQQRIDEAARRAVREHAQSTAPPVQLQQPAAPAQPQRDPRWAQVDELWWTENERAREIMHDIQTDELNARLASERQKIKQEVFTELSESERKQRANFAFHDSMQRLRDMGVPQSELTRDRIVSLYTVTSRVPTQDAPNPYYDRGSILSSEVLVNAWRDLFPHTVRGGQQPSAPAPAPAAPVAPVQPVTLPVAQPPGSSRPAPAAPAPSQRGEPQVHLSAEEKRDIEHLASQFGYDAKKMEERRRKRIAGQSR